MNKRAIFAIVRKDLKVVIQNKGVMMPIVLAPLILFGIIPWLITLLPSLAESLGLSGGGFGDIQSLLDRMPAAFQQSLVGYDDTQRFIVYTLVYMMAPLFLLIPLHVSCVIAADSFAGEKERKTMEALLYTPTTDRDLFIAKLLAAWSAALAVAFLGFVIYVITVNAAGWSSMHRIFFPNAMWILLMTWVVPALPGLGLGVMVIVSARAQGFQDASQIGTIVVLPMLILFFGQLSSGVMFSLTFMIVLGLGIWLLDALLITLGSRSFRRGRLLGA